MSCGLLGPELGSQVALCFTGTFQTCHRESGLFTPCRVGSKPSVCDVALIEFSARVWRSCQEPRATFVSTSRGSTGVVRGLGPLVVRSTPKGRVAEVPSGLRSPPEVALTAHGLRALGSEAGSMQRSTPGCWVPRGSSDAYTDVRTALPMFPSCSRRLEAAVWPCHLPAAVPVDVGGFPPLLSMT